MQTPTRDDAPELAFRAAFVTSYPALVRYARRRVPAADADDVVAEVFLTAWRKWADRPSTDRPLPWLYGIAANVVRNRRRSERRRLRLVERLRAGRQTTLVDGPEPADSLLATAMQRLSFDEQEVLRLSAWEQLSHAEIGEVLGCSVNAVAIRSHRARRRLADQVAALEGRQLDGGRDPQAGTPRRDHDGGAPHG